MSIEDKPKAKTKTKASKLEKLATDRVIGSTKQLEANSDADMAQKFGRLLVDSFPDWINNESMALTVRKEAEHLPSVKSEDPEEDVYEYRRVRLIQDERITLSDCYIGKKEGLVLVGTSKEVPGYEGKETAVEIPLRNAMDGWKDSQGALMQTSIDNILKDNSPEEIIEKAESERAEIKRAEKAAKTMEKKEAYGSDFGCW